MHRACYVKLSGATVIGKMLVLKKADTNLEHRIFFSMPITLGGARGLSCTGIKLDMLDSLHCIIVKTLDAIQHTCRPPKVIINKHALGTFISRQLAVA